MNMFQGFKPSGMEKIANAMGFQGDQKQFQQFLQDNPDRQAEMMRYQDIARKMVEGGYVRRMQEGGDVTEEGGDAPPSKNMRDISADMVTDPKLPTGADIDPYGIPTDEDQLIGTDIGQVGDAPEVDVATADTTKAYAPQTPEVFAFDAPAGEGIPEGFPGDMPPSFPRPEDPRATTEMDAKTSIDDVTAVTDATQILLN